MVGNFSLAYFASVNILSIGLRPILVYWINGGERMKRLQTSILIEKRIFVRKVWFIFIDQSSLLK